MRECLGCETYAKYTHTRVSSCAHFMFASASVRPPGPPSSFLRLFENATPRLPASTLPALARVLYMGPRLGLVAQRGSARRHPRRHVAASLGNVSERSPLATHRWALARFIVHARRLTANRTVRLLYGLRLYKEKMTRSFSLVFIGLAGKKKPRPEEISTRELLISRLPVLTFFLSFE